MTGAGEKNTLYRDEKGSLSLPHYVTSSAPTDLWQRVLDTLKGEIPEEHFELWLRNVRAGRLEAGILHLEVPNRFFSDQLKKNVESRIVEILRHLTQEEIAVAYQLARGPEAASPPPPEIPAPREEGEPFPSEINPRYTFESFVVGPSNRFAHAAAETVAKTPGRAFNPLVIYGGVGLGKTHLMCAIGHALRRSQPRSRVLYTTAEQFLNEYIESIQKSRLDAFRAKYRSLDCLLIDDVQFIIGRGRSEEEFTHTFNDLFDSRKQIVITSDRAPRDMTPMEKRLISRLEWGMVTDIKPPDLETRIAILRRKAEAEGIHFPEDVLNHIAGVIKANIRQLEGSLTRVAAYAAMVGAPPTVDMAKEILKDVISFSDSSLPVSVETIQRVVAQSYNTDIRELKSKSRTEAIAFPRQLAMYLCLTLANKSTTEVGLVFGGRDHTTVMHARDKIKDRLEKDPFFGAHVNKIIEEIRAADNP